MKTILRIFILPVFFMFSLHRYNVSEKTANEPTDYFKFEPTKKLLFTFS